MRAPWTAPPSSPGGDGVAPDVRSRELFGRRTLSVPSSITSDARTERESGITPPPPPFSMKTLIIGLVVLFLIGVTVLSLLMAFGPAFRRALSSNPAVVASVVTARPAARRRGAHLVVAPCFELLRPSRQAALRFRT